MRKMALDKKNRGNTIKCTIVTDIGVSIVQPQPVRQLSSRRACNACHVCDGGGFVHYRLPRRSSHFSLSIPFPPASLSHCCDICCYICCSMRCSMRCYARCYARSHIVQVPREVMETVMSDSMAQAAKRPAWVPHEGKVAVQAAGGMMAV